MTPSGDAGVVVSESVARIVSRLVFGRRNARFPRRVPTVRHPGTAVPLSGYRGRTCQVRGLDLVHAFSKIGSSARYHDTTSIHHVDAVGDRQGLVDVLLDQQHPDSRIRRGTQHGEKPIDDDRGKSD